MTSGATDSHTLNWLVLDSIGVLFYPAKSSYNKKIFIIYLSIFQISVSVFYLLHNIENKNPVENVISGIQVLVLIMVQNILWQKLCYELSD